MMNVFGRKLQDGKDYMKLWPRRKELNGLFPENRIMQVTQFAEHSMPALAVLTLLIQYQFGADMFWPTSVVMVVFMLSLPLQGLFWLGNRANTRLPPSLANWYHELFAKLQQIEEPDIDSVNKPKYRDLALVLKRGFKSLDKAFIKDS
ncbi:terminus macrodomain insulation protein YfbV [Motilimonas pumila]|uniref:UPF0208 membrane protein YfbV n=1 Tax=Motilimonas pumila TaxID=2303987 RepID=A0A418YFJ3_9GAMM|nr:terminus macrodomain insulation protein YfbV [Motilimonas pumila]RJG48157.1 DUF412 domain-containing protein [Motilimonas pumila]